MIGQKKKMLWMNDIPQDFSLKWILDILYCNISSMFRCYILSNFYYMVHQNPKLKYFSSRLAIVFAQSIETRC